ncbi:MAG: hypothetical protein A2V77_10315 [Anaeromyxobacter sp. RBG_16_69_14]|nr:MAG: hypothetical protein A2V77_10315 [Anaeromyxobacter sp. RBG_16_69_14]
MDAYAAYSAFRQLGKLDVVRITGGEPFLREDLGELARSVWLASRPAVLHLTTNGSFPDRAVALAERLSFRSRLSFLVSLDGCATEHDRSRGSEARFAIALETVRRLAALRRLGVRVAVSHTVISPESLDDHVPLKRALRPLGVDVLPVVAYAESATYGFGLRGRRADHLLGSGYPLHPGLAGADVTGFAARALAGLGSIRDPLVRLGKRYYLLGLLSRLRGDVSPSPRPPCVALRSHVRLLPDGSLPVCQFNGETVGRLGTESFDGIWRGARAAAARAWVDVCPGCWAECEVIPSAIYTGDMLRPLAGPP